MARMKKFTLVFDKDDCNEKGICPYRIEIWFEGIKGFGFADGEIDINILDACSASGKSEAEFLLDAAKAYVEAIEQEASYQ